MDIALPGVLAGIAEARSKGVRLGRPATPAKVADRVRALAKNGLSRSEIARRTKVPRTTVRRILAQS